MLWLPRWTHVHSHVHLGSQHSSHRAPKASLGHPVHRCPPEGLPNAEEPTGPRGRCCAPPSPPLPSSNLPLCSLSFLLSYHCRLCLNASSWSTRWKASSSPLSQPCCSLLPSSTSPQSSGKFYMFSNCLVSASPQRDYRFSEARTLPLFGVSVEGSGYSSESGTCRNK